MKIAILGAGFCGLAAAWSLLQLNSTFPELEITLIDSKDIGLGTSGIAAGLLHPFVGLHAKLNHLGIEGFNASKPLIVIAEKHLGRPVADCTGLLRLALTPAQEKSFHLASELYPDDINWLKPDAISAMVPGICSAPGIAIKSGITVFVNEYLQGLWLACQQLGAKFVKRKVNSLQELDRYDKIIVALGADCASLPELSDLPLTRTKGQLLEFKWPKGLAPLPIALNSQLYCVMSADKKHCIAGSTYEKQFDSTQPDVDIAEAEIRPKLEILLPGLADAEITACRSGIRATTSNRQPLIREVLKNCWVFAGMGSKGLLYHALYAELLKHKMFV